MSRRLEIVIAGIWQEELSFSDNIPENFYDEIRAQVPAGTYFRNGVFDEAAYKSAVQAKIREWEDILTPSVLGCGFVSNRDTSGRLIKSPKAGKRQEEADIKWCDEMIALAGGQED